MGKMGILQTGFGVMPLYSTTETAQAFRYDAIFYRSCQSVLLEAKGATKQLDNDWDVRMWLLICV